MARERCAGHDDGQRNGQARDRPAENDRREQMNVNLTVSSDPCARRHQQGNHDAGDPLHQHQHAEQPIDLSVHLIAVFLKELLVTVAAAPAVAFVDLPHCHRSGAHVPGSSQHDGMSKSGQPKTGALLTAGVAPLSSAVIAREPSLPPT